MKLYCWLNGHGAQGVTKVEQTRFGVKYTALVLFCENCHHFYLKEHLDVVPSPQR